MWDRVWFRIDEDKIEMTTHGFISLQTKWYLFRVDMQLTGIFMISESYFLWFIIIYSSFGEWYAGKKERIAHYPLLKLKSTVQKHKDIQLTATLDKEKQQIFAAEQLKST